MKTPPEPVTNVTTVTSLRQKVALSCRILAMTGLVKETTGHVSARIPGTREMFVRGRGPAETGLLFTSEEDVLQVDFDGNGVPPGRGLKTPNELPIHGEIYKAREEVQCVVHAHPPGILLCGLAGLELRPIYLGYDPSATRLALDGVPVFPRAITLHRAEDVHPMLDIMGQKNVCIMRGHGITVTGASVEEATLRAIRLESLARVTWQANRYGRVPDLSPEDMAVISERRERGTDRSHTDEPVWRYYLTLLEKGVLSYEEPLLGTEGIR